MLISYHRSAVLYHAFLLIWTLAVTACESDEAKLQRLQGDRAVQCLLTQKAEREYLDASKPGSSWAPKRDSLLQELRDRDTKCTLATRDLERFMR